MKPKVALIRLLMKTLNTALKSQKTLKYRIDFIKVLIQIFLIKQIIYNVFGFIVDLGEVVLGCFKLLTPIITSQKDHKRYTIAIKRYAYLIFLLIITDKYWELKRL
ncbi:hypothetical protein A9G23_07445 [Gilliamella sp. App4-10]|nr:hypothetical protein A9G23_07445 [Gilliamella apicola]